MGSRGGPPVLQPFIELAEKHAFGRSSVEAFMKSMEMDLTVDSYESYEDLLRYIYGFRRGRGPLHGQDNEA
jgi:phytoene/squalene synthetase